MMFCGGVGAACNTAAANFASDIHETTRSTTPTTKAQHDGSSQKTDLPMVLQINTSVSEETLNTLNTLNTPLNSRGDGKMYKTNNKHNKNNNNLSNNNHNPSSSCGGEGSYSAQAMNEIQSLMQQQIGLGRGACNGMLQQKQATQSKAQAQAQAQLHAQTQRLLQEGNHTTVASTPRGLEIPLTASSCAYQNANLSPITSKLSSVSTTPRVLLNPLSPNNANRTMSRIPSAMATNSTSTTRSTSRMQSSSSNSAPSTRTFQTLTTRLENGFRANLHNGESSVGKEVVISLLSDRSCLMIRPFNEDCDNDFATVHFPIRAVLRLEIGKTKSSVLSKPMYDHIHAMTCFSIVVKLWSVAENYFDFEASSVIEREALISTLMVVLDQTHNKNSNDDINENSKNKANDKVSIKNSHNQANYLSPNNPLTDKSAHKFTFKQEMDCEKNPATTQPETHRLSQIERTQIHHCGDSTADEGTEISVVYNNSRTDLSEVVETHCKQRNADNAVHSPTMQTDVLLCETRDTEVVTVPTECEKGDAREGDVGDCSFECVHIPGALPKLCSDLEFDASKLGGSWCVDDVCTLALKDIAETCRGIFEKKQNEKDTTDQRIIEEFIAGVLGEQASAMVSFITDGDAWTADLAERATKTQCTTTTATAEMKPTTAKKTKFTNRATLLNAQAQRLRTLRNEMTFAAALKRSTEKMHYVQTIKSFDDAERTKQSRDYAVGMKLHSSPLFERVVGSMVMNKPDDINDYNGGEQDAPYYDSDPEDVRPRETRKGPRQVIAERQNSTPATEDSEKKEKATHTDTETVLSGVGFEKIVMGKKLRKIDESLIMQIVQAMRNENLTLIWHPTQTKQHPNRSPICVNLWIESGMYLFDGSFLLPRLSWMSAYEKNLESKKLNVSQQEPEQVVLLDVCRIRATDKIDRRLHPFPDPRKSFTVETQEDLFLFETKSSMERDRIVYGLKLVIARLASLLMLRDIRALEEFFGSVSMGPGAAPQWAQSQS